MNMPPKKGAPPKGSLAALIASADEKYNMTVGSLNDIVQDSVFLSTGNIAIDGIMGGGIPLGRSVELAGPPSSGKTTTALQACGVLQKIIIGGGDERLGVKPDDFILYLDYEQTIDKAYCAGLGLDITHPSFLISQPDTLEDGANFTRDAVRSGEVRLTVVDSVAAMVPSANSQNEIGKSMAFTAARLLADFGQQMNPILRENHSSLIYVNHLKDILDMSGRRPAHLGPAKGTPGGSALKFYASVRVEYKQLQKFDLEVTDPLTKEKVKQPYATNVEIKTVKNKVFPPFRKAVARVRFGQGFDNFWTAMQILVANKVVMYQGGYYYFHKAPTLITDWMPKQSQGIQRPYIRGDRAIFAAADDKPEWRDEAIRLATEIAADPEALAMVAQQEEGEEEDDEVDIESGEVGPGKGQKISLLR